MDLNHTKIVKNINFFKVGHLINIEKLVSYIIK